MTLKALMTIGTRTGTIGAILRAGLAGVSFLALGTGAALSAGPENQSQPIIGPAPAETHEPQQPETPRGPPLPPGGIELVIPFTETGGSARWANFYAKMLGEALPEKPAVLVRYRPGAGSTAGTNWFDQQTGRGEDLLFGTSSQTQFSYLLGDPRATYDYEGWNPLLASGTGGVIYGDAALARAFAEDPGILRDVPIRYGAVGATGLDLVPLLALELLGVKISDPFKFDNRSETRRAFLRGDTDLDFQTGPAFHRNAAARNGSKGVPLMTFGALDAEGRIVRDPHFPDVPTVIETCIDLPRCRPEGPGWEAWRAFFIGGFAAQKMLFAPADAAQTRVASYHDALQKVLEEADFVARSAEALDPYPQLSADAARAALEAVTALSAQARKHVRDWLETRYGVVIE